MKMDIATYKLKIFSIAILCLPVWSKPDYEHKCDLFQCTSYSTCYGFREYCSRAGGLKLSCFPSDVKDRTLQEISDWCHTDHPLKNPQCKFACADVEMELYNRTVDVPCLQYSCALQGGKSECFGNQQFCNRTAKKVQSCFPEALQNNETKLSNWCQGDPQPVDKQCKFACSDRFPELRDSSATKLQTDTCELYSCLSPEGKWNCYDNQEFCNRTAGRVQSCFTPENSCQTGYSSVNQQCQNACTKQLDETTLALRVAGIVCAFLFLFIILVKVAMVLWKRLKKYLQRFCQGCRQRENDSTDETSSGHGIPLVSPKQRTDMENVSGTQRVQKKQAVDNPTGERDASSRCCQ